MATDKKTPEEVAANDAESKKGGEAFESKLSKIKDEDERKVLELYNQGVQNFTIAKEVYKFANSQSVAQVINIIRKHYADDYNEVESLNDYKGYVGL